jgi:hypothetical protein
MEMGFCKLFQNLFWELGMLIGFHKKLLYFKDTNDLDAENSNALTLPLSPCEENWSRQDNHNLCNLLNLLPSFSRYLQRSIMWFLQMAQLSTTISQAHKATAFHCKEKKREQCTLLVT